MIEHAVNVRIFNFMKPRLHSGNIEGNPVLVEEMRKFPTHLVVSRDVLNDLIREDTNRSNYNFLDQTYMGMRISVLQSSSARNFAEVFE